MEDRLNTGGHSAHLDVRGAPVEGRPGLALVALVVIALTTVAWWALALYPVNTATPHWLARTQAVCFGTGETGLPSAGGWILLIGEPVGMVIALLVIWGGSLRRDLHWLRSRRWGPAVMAAAMAALAFGMLAAAQRVRGALGQAGEPFDVTGSDQPVQRPGTPAPALVLVDQHGERFDLASLQGGTVIVTFAFAHCATVCPTVVQDVRAARRQAGAATPIVVVTLDPWRDVPARLPHIARGWQLEEGDRVLSGSVDEVNAALDAWQVPRSRDASTGEVVHATVVLVVDSQGRIDARMQEGFYRLTGLLPAGPG